MPKVWNLGNTTVRNPNRLRDGLIVLEREFNGNLSGDEREGAYSQRLNELGIIESAGTEPAWFGRKWRSAFVKLGFITEKFSKKQKAVEQRLSEDFGFTDVGYEVTPAGQLLIGADSLGAIEDIFTRQLIQHEIASPLEGSFPDGSMKPFILFLQVLHRLYREKKPGLNKVEIAAFIQLFRNHTSSIADEIVLGILEYRKKREACRDKREKVRCDRDVLELASRLHIEGGIAADSLGDYADTTVRYSKMSGLIAQEGSRVVVRETKVAFIEAVLSREPVFLATTNPNEYLKKFYSGAEIPTDDRVFAHQEISRVGRRLEEMGKVVPQGLITKAQSDDVKELEQVRYKLLELVNQSQEEIYAIDQQREEFIREILDGLTAFGVNGAKHKFIDPPTYFEWIVWRSFLAIDHIAVPVHTTRRFPLDEDLLPRHPAPGGGPDMLFEFDDFILVVEVTLKTSSRQEADEGAPVRKHVEGVSQNTGKDVYGVFIAPSIDTNTAETFRVGVWYHQDEERYLKIVPFSIEQFTMIFAALLERRYTPVDLKDLIEKCLHGRNEMRAPDWKKFIDVATKTWQGTIIAKREESFIDQIEKEINDGLKFVEYLPVYDLQAVATTFREQRAPSVIGWTKMPKGFRSNKDMFIAQVVGRSMEPMIKENSWCLFRLERGGHRDGVYLVESKHLSDPDTQASFTVKRYHSEKEYFADEQWRHKRIVLSPDNKEFQDIVLEGVSGEDFRIVAEFVNVIA